MNRFVSNTVISISIIQFIFVLILSIYYIYLSLEWGLNERVLLLLLSDSAYVLLIPSTVALLLQQKWGWWYTVIVYCKLFFAKITVAAAEMFMFFNDSITETFQMDIFLLDVVLTIFFVAIIIFFFLHKVRLHFSVNMRKTLLLFFVIISSLILYVIHFIMMLLVLQIL